MTKPKLIRRMFYLSPEADKKLVDISKQVNLSKNKVVNQFILNFEIEKKGKLLKRLFGL